MSMKSSQDAMFKCKCWGGQHNKITPFDTLCVEKHYFTIPLLDNRSLRRYDSEAVVWSCSVKKMFLNISHKIHTKTPVSESLF